MQYMRRPVYMIPALRSLSLRTSLSSLIDPYLNELPESHWSLSKRVARKACFLEMRMDSVLWNSQNEFGQYGSPAFNFTRPPSVNKTPESRRRRMFDCVSFGGTIVTIFRDFARFRVHIIEGERLSFLSSIVLLCTFLLIQCFCEKIPLRSHGLFARTSLRFHHPFVSLKDAA